MIPPANGPDPAPPALERVSEMMVLVGPRQLQERIAELARQLDADLAGRDAVMLVVLKGGFFFAADLVRAMTVPVPLVFATPRAEGAPLLALGGTDRRLVAGRLVVVVDALLDRGGSMARLLEALHPLHPAEVRLAILLHKSVGLKEPLPVQYLGFEVPDVRLVGYGLDEGQEFRSLPAVYAWREDSPFAHQGSHSPSPV